jgi:hypothetical protein
MWAEFNVTHPEVSDSIVLLDDGTAVLGNTTYSDGALIDDIRFSDNFTAERPRGFANVLKVSKDTGETYFFRYDDENWYRRVPVAEGARPIAKLRNVK